MQLNCNLPGANQSTNQRTLGDITFTATMGIELKGSFSYTASIFTLSRHINVPAIVVGLVASVVYCGTLEKYASLPQNNMAVTSSDSDDGGNPLVEEKRRPSDAAWRSLAPSPSSGRSGGQAHGVRHGGGREVAEVALAEDRVGTTWHHSHIPALKAEDHQRDARPQTSPGGLQGQRRLRRRVRHNHRPAHRQRIVQGALRSCGEAH